MRSISVPDVPICIPANISKSTIEETLEKKRFEKWCQRCPSIVFILNFKHITHLYGLFLLLTLSMFLFC